MRIYILVRILELSSHSHIGCKYFSERICQLPKGKIGSVESKKQLNKYLLVSLGVLKILRNIGAFEMWYSMEGVSVGQLFGCQGPIVRVTRVHIITC